MFCNACGTERPDLVRVCPKCGQPSIATPPLTHFGIKKPERMAANNLTRSQGFLIVFGILVLLVIFGLLTDTSKPTAGKEEAAVPIQSTYRDTFISKLQSLMNKADSDAYSERLVHPTASANLDDKSVLNIDCPKVEPTGGSGDGLCLGVYQGFKSNAAMPNEARMADFDRVVIMSPHFYKILVLRGEPCSPSVVCDALVDSGKIEKIP